MKAIHQIEEALSRHSYRLIDPGARAHAAVAIILDQRADGVNILFIERSTNENDPWSGHIGFPGGKVESSDSCPKDAAQREAMEELGIELRASRYLGRISDVAPPGLRLVVSGFVYAVDGIPHLTLARDEVAKVFWLPLKEIANPLHRSYVRCKWHERMRHYPALELFEENKKPIWGITYRLLRNFSKAIAPPLNKGGVLGEWS